MVQLFVIRMRRFTVFKTVTESNVCILHVSLCRDYLKGGNCSLRLCDTKMLVFFKWCGLSPELGHVLSLWNTCTASSYAVSGHCLRWYPPLLLWYCMCHLVVSCARAHSIDCIWSSLLPFLWSHSGTKAYDSRPCFWLHPLAIPWFLHIWNTFANMCDPRHKNYLQASTDMHGSL